MTGLDARSRSSDHRARERRVMEEQRRRIYYAEVSPSNDLRERIWRERLYMYRYARTLFGKHRGEDKEAAAEDLLMSTVVRALSRLHLFSEVRPDGQRVNLRSWLMAIMHNLYVNGVRAAAREGIKQEITPPLVQEHGALQTRPGQEKALAQRDLVRALNKLPEEQRVAILLSTIHEMTYDTVAQTVGCEIGTVRSRISRGRATLRRLMMQDPLLSDDALADITVDEML